MIRGRNVFLRRRRLGIISDWCDFWKRFHCFLLRLVPVILSNNLLSFFLHFQWFRFNDWFIDFGWIPIILKIPLRILSYVEPATLTWRSNCCLFILIFFLNFNNFGSLSLDRRFRRSLFIFFLIIKLIKQIFKIKIIFTSLKVQIIKRIPSFLLSHFLSLDGRSMNSRAHMRNFNNWLCNLRMEDISSLIFLYFIVVVPHKLLFLSLCAAWLDFLLKILKKIV